MTKLTGAAADALAFLAGQKNPPAPASAAPGTTAAQAPLNAAINTTRAGTGPAPASTVILARVVVVFGPNQGIFDYNGTPGPGNPPIFAIVAPGTTTDPYGNRVEAVMNIGALSGAHLGADDSGNLYLADSTGATRIYMSPSAQLLAFYTAGTAGLLMTLAGSAGTDPLTHSAYPQGLQFYGGIPPVTGASGSYARVSDVSGIAAVVLGSGAPGETPAHMSVDVVGTGPYYTEFGVVGPQASTPFNDYAWMGLQSAGDTGIGNAGGNLYYADTAGATHLLMEWGSSGLFSTGLTDQNPMPVGELIVYTTATFPVNTFGYAGVTGLNCTMAANSVYFIEGIIFAENVTAAAADLFACTFVAGTTVSLRANFLEANAGAQTANPVTSTSGVLTSPAFAAGHVYYLEFSGIVTTPGTSGSFVLQASESAAGDTWEIFANSYVKIRRISGG